MVVLKYQCFHKNSITKNIDIFFKRRSMLLLLSNTNENLKSVLMTKQVNVLPLENQYTFGQITTVQCTQLYSVTSGSTNTWK